MLFLFQLGLISFVSGFVDKEGAHLFPRYFITVLCGIPDIVIIPFISSKLIHQCDFFPYRYF